MPTRPAGAAGRPVRRARPPAYRARIALVLVLGLALGLLVVVTRSEVRSGHGIDGLSSDRLVPALHRPACGVSRLLVPSCGRWWGMAPLARTDVPLADAVPQEEVAIRRPLDIVHVYHRNGELFPTAAERRLALQPGYNRLLLINWKPATDMTWRAVADGAADARIDALAAYIRANFRHPFFLTIWHEPENDVVPRAGSGMTASDYAAMYRHVVLRLRADRMPWAVTVMTYIAFDKWARKSWFASLWPGDDVVDWVGLDPYGTGAKTGYNAHDFPTLVNRREGGFPGYYTWATTKHRGKPIMLAEWGVEADPANPSGQSAFFGTVASTIDRFPQIKALVYYDMPDPPPGQLATGLQTNAATLAAYRSLSRRAAVVGPRITYGG